jgi:hypothetical protein
MVYIKAAVVGILTGFLAIAVAVVIVVTYEWVSFVSSQQDFGGGGIGVVSSGLTFPGPVFLVGFAAGFYRTIRRARRRQLAH